MGGGCVAAMTAHKVSTWENRCGEINTAPPGPVKYGGAALGKRSPAGGGEDMESSVSVPKRPGASAGLGTGLLLQRGGGAERPGPGTAQGGDFNSVKSQFKMAADAKKHPRDETQSPLAPLTYRNKRSPARGGGGGVIR